VADRAADSKQPTVARLRALLHRRAAELRLGVRITLAGLGTYLLAQWVGLPQGYWAVFTAVIVTQGSVGGSLKASRDRLIGTIGGALYGAAVATLIPHADPRSFVLVLAITLAPLALAAAIYPRYRIAPVTGAILLLSSAAQMGPLEAAAYRIMEISLGCVVGLAVSLVILPARAHGLTLRAAGRVLGLLSRQVAAHRASLLGDGGGADIAPLNNQIRAAMARLDAAAGEYRHERASHLADQGDLEPVIRTLRRVRNDLVMVGRTAATPLAEPIRDRLGPSLRAALDAVSEALAATGDALAAGHAPPPLEPLAAALDAHGAAIAAIRRDGLTHSLPDESVASLFALGFALEQLRRDFEDLHARAGELART
jgi:uncharacterized membrane protein YccC